MPELPEVETVRRSLERAMRGRRLERVELGTKRLRHPIPRAGLAALAGRTLGALRRRGKVLLLDFPHPRDPDVTALVHLGMSGRMLARDARVPREVHEHARFHFVGRVVSFVDPRRFGSIELAETASLDAHPRIATLGPEPLGDGVGHALDGAHLYAATRRRRIALRNLLLDGRVVAGLGNIYANEACFEARLRPGRAAGRITRADAERLAIAIRSVLERAVAAGGTTLDDGGYVDGEGNPGWFQLQVGVYDRAGQPCRRCTTPIRSLVLGQRTAYYCRQCQR